MCKEGEVVRLRNGVSVPQLGLGTSHNGGFSQQAVELALKRGCRHIDTAQRYGSEEGVGRALAAWPREDIFITTKETTTIVATVGINRNKNRRDLPRI